MKARQLSGSEKKTMASWRVVGVVGVSTPIIYLKNIDFYKKCGVFHRFFQGGERIIGAQKGDLHDR